MNGDADDVWPPQPARQNSVEPHGSSKSYRVELAFDVVSLALTLPGLLWCVLLELNGLVMRWAFIPAAMEALSYFFIASMFILPFFGFCAGVVGRRLVFGKLSIAASVILYGDLLVGFWRDTL